MEERLARLADVVVPVPAESCTPLLMGPSRRPDPAWLWYGVAAAALLAVLILELTGVLGRLGP